MIYLATIVPLEAVWGLFMLGFCAGATVTVLIAARVTRPNSSPRCPHCNARLRRVTVRDLTHRDCPSDAAWVCPGRSWVACCGRRTTFFADLPTGKPDPIEEV